MIEDRWEAIRWAIGSAQTDDCVVIVGRGHKDYVDWRFDDQIARVSSASSWQQKPCCEVLVSLGDMGALCQAADISQTLLERAIPMHKVAVAVIC